MACNTPAVGVCCSNNASSRSAAFGKFSITLGKLTFEIGYALLGIG